MKYAKSKQVKIARVISENDGEPRVALIECAFEMKPGAEDFALGNSGTDSLFEYGEAVPRIKKVSILTKELIPSGKQPMTQMDFDIISNAIDNAIEAAVKNDYLVEDYLNDFKTE